MATARTRTAVSTGSGVTVTEVDIPCPTCGKQAGRLYEYGGAWWVVHWPASVTDMDCKLDPVDARLVISMFTNEEWD